jgi:hypothetical protein
MSKFCIGCDQYKKPEYFYKVGNTRCIDCTNAYNREKREKKKDERVNNDISMKFIGKLISTEVCGIVRDIIHKQFDSNKQENMTNWLENIDNRLDKIDNRLDNISDKLDKVLLIKNGPIKSSFSKK